uniref:DUF2591 domain-containing protein n=1 Tax=Steinernema glaseri TaxID=37863 RepID=A0A1I7YIP0_9BILA
MALDGIRIRPVRACSWQVLQFGLKLAEDGWDPYSSSSCLLVASPPIWTEISAGWVSGGCADAYTARNSVRFLEICLHLMESEVDRQRALKFNPQLQANAIA